MEIWWQFGGILVAVWWKFGGSLVAVWWKFGGSLVAVLVSPFTCKCKLWNRHQTATKLPPNCRQTSTKLPPNFHQISIKMASIFQKKWYHKYGKIWENPWTRHQNKIQNICKRDIPWTNQEQQFQRVPKPAMSFHEMFELFFGSVTTIETKGLRHEQSTGEKTLKQLWEILRRPNHT